MESYDISALSESIMAKVTDFADEYDATEAVDYAARIMDLKPGSPLPDRGKIESLENRRHIDNYAYGVSSDIAEICEAERTKLHQQMIAPPDDEALRMMQTISMRGDSINETELDALHDKFGSNYQVRRFVAEQKQKLGGEYAGIETDMVDEALSMIDAVQKIGQNNVRVSTIEQSPFGKEARLAIIKQELAGDGLFKLF